jgi:hypothetical protein
VKYKLIALIAGSVVIVCSATVVDAATSQHGNLRVHTPTLVAGNFSDLSEAMSLLAQERGHHDQLSVRAASVFAQLASASHLIEPTAAARSRKIGGRNGAPAVWIVPSKTGFAYVTEDSAALVPGTLGPQMPAAGARIKRSVDEPVHAFGVVADTVKSVEIVVGRDSFRATISDNVYSWVAPTASLTLESISVRVHLEDGTIVGL